MKTEEFVIVEDETAEEPPATDDTTDCAWCNAEAGREQGEGSHGICGEHAEAVYAAYAARRAA